MDADRAVPNPEWEGGITPGVYMTRAMLWEVGIDWPEADIKRMVKEYAPEKEIAVAILRGGDTDYYRFGGQGKTPRGRRRGWESGWGRWISG